ncbi:hypothetical protein ACFYZ9_31060 [Streptomyces sp. NPDC001691]
MLVPLAEAVARGIEATRMLDRRGNAPTWESGPEMPSNTDAG